MASAKPAAVKLPNSYELLAVRVQKIINSSGAQKAKAALIGKIADESDDDWAQLLGEIAENDNVILAHRDDGAVQLFWQPPSDD
ncbi:MAG: DUF1654 domain-containing protein [Pseudomonadaceae bacterium]|jgi:hypothetical protein|nr:DUF1654 domain-containing protein [Pseudomonadaceae bacterium]